MYHAESKPGSRWSSTYAPYLLVLCYWWGSRGLNIPPDCVPLLPTGADRKQAKTVGDTKNSIPIPTEQETVAPEAFPNPAAGIAPEPPVLSGALGDEQYGPNANQFKGLGESDRQKLIDEKSPAESSRSN